MNRIKSAWPLAALLAVALIAEGCASFQTNSIKTYASITTAVEAARKGWVAYVTDQRVKLANDPVALAQLEKNVATVGVIYGQYQLAAKAANDAIIAYANSPTDQSPVVTALNMLSAASSSLIPLIQQLTK